MGKTLADDSYDAIYAMSTGAWQTVQSGVLFQPLPQQGQWDSWLLEEKLEFATTMLDLMVGKSNDLISDW